MAEEVKGYADDEGAGVAVSLERWLGRSASATEGACGTE